GPAVSRPYPGGRARPAGCDGGGAARQNSETAVCNETRGAGWSSGTNCSSGRHAVSLETHEREMTLSERARDAVVDAGQLLMSGFEWWLLRSSQIPATPFLDRADFAWAPALEAGWRDIRAELDEGLTQRADLPNIQDIVADTVPISGDDGWKTFFFTAYGYRSDDTRARCPATAAMIDQIPGLVTAFFSILSPGKHIPPHRGPFRGVVRCHLALKIPDPPDSCGIKVNGETRHWAEGKTMFFDDGYEHSAWNDSGETRVVLWLDVIRPLRR